MSALRCRRKNAENIKIVDANFVDMVMALSATIVSEADKDKPVGRMQKAAKAAIEAIVANKKYTRKEANELAAALLSICREEKQV